MLQPLLVERCPAVSRVIQTQHSGSEVQVDSWSTLARERGGRPGGVLGWQSRPVWHRAGNPMHNTDERTDSSCFLLEGRPSGGALWLRPVGRILGWKLGGQTGPLREEKSALAANWR